MSYPTWYTYVATNGYPAVISNGRMVQVLTNTPAAFAEFLALIGHVATLRSEGIGSQVFSDNHNTRLIGFTLVPASRNMAMSRDDMGYRFVAAIADDAE